MLTINVVTLFPEVFGGALGASILGRAAQLGLARYRVVQLRDYAHDRHRTVDDSPYGGGAGMDSHYDGVLSPPSYTRPPSYRGLDVPAVLLSGDHDKIAEWRAAEVERITRERRPDLWAKRLEE